MENVKENTIDCKAELNKNGVLAFVPRGNSMWPMLKHKGQSVVVKAKTERLKRWDVALYVRGQNTFVLHRVLEVLPDGYVICGDSQFDLEKVLEEQIFGVMIGFYRGKKYIDATDEKYLKKVEKWYKRKGYRKFRLKIFFFTVRVKNKLKRIFKGNKEDV